MASVERPDRATAYDEHVTVACEDNLVFMKRIHDSQMKLVITSPPYNLGKDYEDKASLDDYLEMQARVVAECVRVLHPQGSLCWQVGNYVNNGERSSPLIPSYFPFSAVMGSSSAIGSSGTSGMAYTPQSDCPGDMRRSTGGRRTTTTLGTSTQLEFHRSIQASAISRGLILASCRETRKERIRVMYGGSPMSRTTTLRRQFTPASSPLN